MNGKQILGMALALAMLVGSLGGSVIPAAAAETAAAKIPLVARYNTPAEVWESEATPLGNGFIGGMVFGGVESDRIQINEKTLWSGGPGANTGFDGGASGDKAAIHSALQQVRRLLQEEMTNFTQNSAAKVVNGQVVANNYPGNSTVTALLEQLKGEKNNFGSYQTLGNLNLIDPAYVTAMLVGTSSNAEPTDGGEGSANLFDGSTGTKWFAGNSAAGGGMAAPYIVEWSYTDAKRMDGYRISAANDMEGRDPRAWVLYGSNDGSNYTKIDERNGVTFADRYATNTYTIASAVSYKYYRLTVTATRENLPVQLSEIELTDSRTVNGQNYTNYERALDLDNGMATVTYTLDGVTYTREYFVSNPGNVMVVRLSASQGGKINRLVSVTSEQNKKTITVNGDTISMVGQPADQRADGLQFAQQVKVIPTGGTLTSSAAGVMINGADSAVIVMSCGTNYQQCMDNTYDYFSDADPMAAVSARVNAAASKSYDALLAAHKADYQALFGAVELNLGFTRQPSKTTAQLLSDYKSGAATTQERRYLETLYYQFGRYLLIGSSREGSLPANLQGIWAEGMNPPWSADYHTNINVQMNYWLAQQTNLEECHMPVIDYINAQVARGAETAKLYHCTEEGVDARGWTMYHENNIWGNTMPAVSDAFYFPAGAAWMCQDIWEYYAFTMDEAFLAENFDTLLGAAIFWVDNLWTDTRDGTLVSNPSYSPEHGPYSLGTSCDQEIIWELFTEVVKAAEILEIRDARASQVNEVKAALQKLYMPKVGLSGIFLEWKDETAVDIVGDYGHRHVNQLYAVHPGTYVVAGRSDWDDDMVEAMKKVLTIRGDGGTGWSKAWKINFWARLRDGDHAATMVSEILKESTLTNLFDTHPPFQIDGNFGSTAGMTEMLLQSQGASIDLLAALPNVWADGYVSGLKARGNFTIDMEWASSKLTAAEITSNAGGNCTIRFDGVETAAILEKSSGRTIATTKNADGSVTFATTKGASYVVSVDGSSADIGGAESIVLDACDSRDGWNISANLSAGVDTADRREGAASLSVSGNSDALYFSKGDFHCAIPANWDQVYLNLWVYIDNAADLHSLVIEAAQSVDQIERQFILEAGDFSLTNGWNRLSLPMGSREQLAASGFDVFQSLRVFALDIHASLTMKLDAISLSTNSSTSPNTTTRIEAEDYVDMYGVQTEACGEGTEDVGYIDDGDWVEYAVNVPADTAYTLNLRVASPNGGNQVHVEANGQKMAYLTIPQTGDWQVYTTVTSADFTLPAGTTRLRLYIPVGGINLNWLELVPAAVVTPPATATVTYTPARADGGAFITDDGSVNNLHLENSYMEFEVEGNGGEAQLTLVYAMQDTSATAGVSVNGVALAPLTLTSSGSWTDYSGTATFTATLNAGTNVIRFTGGQGGYNVARLEVTAAASAVHVEAEDYADMYGVQAEPCGEGTQNIGYIENGEWLDYTVNVPVGGTYRLVLRAASPGGGALVALQRDGATLTQVAVDATGDWQTYQSFTSGTFQLNAGTQTLRVAIPIAGVNLNWFELIPA